MRPARRRAVDGATEYLALTLPGPPARVAPLLAVAVDDVHRWRESATAERIAGLRRALNHYTLTEDTP